MNDDCHNLASADALLHHLIERQAARTPDRTAVVSGGQSLTYACLAGWADQLAISIRGRLGDRDPSTPQPLVGVCMDRCLELPVALLAVLKAGAAYVPLDPDYPRSRLEALVADASPPLIVTHSHTLPRVKWLASHTSILCVDEADRNASGMPPAEDRVSPGDCLPATAEQLAYVLYTSGTTGTPKGAMNTHRGIINRLQWMQDRYQIGPSDAVLQKTPMSFDVSVWEFFWPLIAGSRLVLAQPGGHLDASYLCDLIQDERITITHFVPSMLRVFLAEPRLERCQSLRQVICSGEALSADLARLFHERLDCRLDNLYGPTEAAIDVTAWECRPDDTRTIVPIGHPVANTQIHVLDEQLQPVPDGEIGELYIGGVQVALGYLNRPDLTAERFLPDPFAAGSNTNAQLYKTGDLGRRLPDGSLEFLGRVDHQVKIRGFRIELGEIEFVLEKVAGVAQAIVAAHDYGPDDHRLVAYLVPQQHGERSELVAAARTAVQQQLPEYMLPAVFMVLAEVPLTANGKLDRKALPAPTRARPDIGLPAVPPGSELETRLVELWQRLLQLDEIGIHDRFFELGGDSLRAAEFVNEVQHRLGEFVYVTTLFEAPTVAEYAAFLLRDYAGAVGRWLGIEVGSGSSVREQPDRIDEGTLARFRAAIPLRGAPPSDPNEREATRRGRNPRIVLILAPPRSGTTLLRVMLAGHPQLFAASELQLLCFHTLSERRTAFAGRHAAWLDGLIRTWMELHGCSADEAKQAIRLRESQDLSTGQFYRLLQQDAGGRTLVDKSPHYALDRTCLDWAELEFAEPFYIHLARHPYAAIRSFESQHMDQIVYLGEHDFSARQLGELIWTVSHDNTLDFLATVDPQRQFRLAFEDLVRQPRPIMEELCGRLGIPFDPELLEPYRNQDRKMVDGVHAASTPMGDVRFLEHAAIRPEVADRWQAVRGDDFLGPPTWRVAEQLGYTRPTPSQQETSRFRDRRTAAREQRQQQFDRRNRRIRPSREK